MLREIPAQWGPDQAIPRLGTNHTQTPVFIERSFFHLGTKVKVAIFRLTEKQQQMNHWLELFPSISSFSFKLYLGLSSFVQDEKQQSDFNILYVECIFDILLKSFGCRYCAYFWSSLVFIAFCFFFYFYFLNIHYYHISLIGFSFEIFLPPKSIGLQT